MKNTAPQDTGLAGRVEILFIVVAWLLFLTLAVRVLGPDSAHTTFNSDSAIPILMANDERPVTVFDTYYYAADRWGGWPLLLAKELHRDTGLQWTDQRLHYVRTTWLFFGLLVLASLNARAAPAVIVSGLMALTLEPALRRRLFDLSQLYAWQLTALFLAWFCLRHFFAQRPRSDAAYGILWSSAFYFCAFFAIWSSVASAPLLSVLVIVEALRSRFSFQNPITKRRIGLAVVLLLAATASELLMKINYHRYSLKHFGYDYKTPMALDRGHLFENLLRNWENLTKFSSFPLIAVALCFVVGIAVLILYASMADKAALRIRVLSFFEDETITMIVALTAMAAINFLIMVSVNHVRLSHNDDRFQTPSYLFGAISGLLTIYLAIRVFANRIGVTRHVLPLVLVGAFVFLGVAFPRRQLSETYKTDRQTALALSQKAPPGSMLMGTYWQTYVYAALQPTNTMTPLPLEGLQNRIPWTVEMLHDSQQVVIEYKNSGFEGSLPPNELWQYGNLLRLQEAHFYGNGQYAFALYSKDRRKP